MAILLVVIMEWNKVLSLSLLLLKDHWNNVKWRNNLILRTEFWTGKNYDLKPEKYTPPWAEPLRIGLDREYPRRGVDVQCTDFLIWKESDSITKWGENITINIIFFCKIDIVANEYSLRTGLV